MKYIGFSLLIALLLLTLSYCVLPPSRPPVQPVSSIQNFGEAKKLLNKIFKNHQQTFYCGCSYDKKNQIDPSTCGYTPRKNAQRGERVEWEHIVPAHAFGGSLTCWQQPICQREGKSYKGRKCCEEQDPLFQSMEGDMHNLVPAVGELNADRSNRIYGMVAGEARVYGACDFEVDFERDVVEPRPEIRGDIARTYFYFEKTYQLPINDTQRTLFETWAKEDPVDEWELERHNRIKAIQGNGNPFVESPPTP